MDNRMVACLIALILVLGACAGETELSPEIAAHLNAYEELIEKFEPEFDRVRNDPPRFAQVAETWRTQSEDWINQWGKVAPDLSEKEGKAIQASLNKLNRRAMKMLTGS